jgi:hypothetical protein
MKKISIAVAILLLAGCSGMRSSGSSYGASGTGSYDSGGPSAYSYTGYFDNGRALSQSHTLLYAEDPFPSNYIYR